MPHPAFDASYTLFPRPPAPALPRVPPTPASTSSLFGSGLLRPFVRDQKNDFANDATLALVKACVGQILGTRAGDDSGERQGEIEWRPAFGSKLYLLQHRKGPMLVELARHYVIEALTLWEPRVRSVKSNPVFDSRERLLAVDLRYDVITANVAGNQVLFSDVDQTVSLSTAP